MLLQEGGLLGQQLLVLLGESVDAFLQFVNAAVISTSKLAGLLVLLHHGGHMGDQISCLHPHATVWVVQSTHRQLVRILLRLGHAVQLGVELDQRSLDGQDALLRLLLLLDHHRAPARLLDGRLRVVAAGVLGSARRQVRRSRFLARDNRDRVRALPICGAGRSAVLLLLLLLLILMRLSLLLLLRLRLRL